MRDDVVWASEDVRRVLGGQCSPSVLGTEDALDKNCLVNIVWFHQADRSKYSGFII